MRPLQRGLRIARMCGLGIDARRVRRTTNVVELAQASRWIAANLCSIRGVPFVHAAASRARVVGVRTNDLMRLCAELAARPSLVDPELLPLAWRLALRGVGIPMLDGPHARALDAGVSVVVPLGARPYMLAS
ncbi:MAG: hypothetical protein ACKV2T_27555 [Kofleriaceae bacterium]